ncbi:MAG: efflux RND transporter permease subunit [Rikenellaceae bacterium]
MNLSELSIRRPVLSSVMIIVIIIFGLVGYNSLGVREFPSVDNPTVTVSVSYTGANSDVIMNQITEPIEQQVNGIPGIRTLTSTSSYGSSKITIEFDLEVDMERAANDVRDKVSQAQRYLPDDCDPPTVSKADADSDPIIRIAVNGDDRYSLMQLTEIAELTVKEQLQTISDVSSVTVWGQRYSMRLWLDAEKMAGNGVTPIDVKNALDKENVELPSGSIEGDMTTLTIRAMGLMSSPEEFNNIIIRQSGNSIVRFRDIGYAELGPDDMRESIRINGRPASQVMVIPQPGANHIDIANEVYKRLESMDRDLPEGISLRIMVDNTRFVRASINEVQETIYIAFLLVVIIIFLFLRDWRVTLVPVAVIPVSLIGAFFVMFICGFSINVLTMLAVVLSVGLVVDDAIVVTENIYTKIEHGMKPIDAGIEGSKEIFFAVISTTITLVSVFLPIIFLDGTTGRLFREFSMVISGSVIISSFAALTFTPMLATKILKRREKQNAFYRFTEPFFEGLNSVYDRSLGWFLRFRMLAIPIVLLLMALAGYLWITVPAELSPLEDRSQMFGSINIPEGATYEFAASYVDDVENAINELVPEAKNVMVRANSSGGFAMIALVDYAEREATQMEIAQRISQHLTSKYSAGRTFMRQSATIGGGKGGMPVQYVLQAQNLEKLREFLPLFMDEVNSSPVFAMANENLKFTKPESRMIINRDKANSMGVSTKDVAQVLQYGISGQRMGYFYRDGKQYEILAEINRQQRNTPLSIQSLYLRNSASQMVQLDNLISLHEDVSPPTLYRFNRFVSATISTGLAPGYTIGDGVVEMHRIADEILDDTFRTALTGESREFSESSSSLIFAFIFALVLIYLVLAAQFESFKDPMVIMLTVPLAVVGAVGYMMMMSQTMNIFSQIGIIMLIGLVAKNGILIVEFANQRRGEGLTKLEAVRTAAVQRMRPILMTSISTVLGLIPLVFATGEGSRGRIAMGVAVVGGMVFSTILTLYIVPAVYSYISSNREADEAQN